MTDMDLILDGSHTPDYNEIEEYIGLPEREQWKKLNLFIQERYKASPKIMYSKCSGKPGWNVKYQKSGKSICTLYPERDGFVALIVITLGLVPLVEAIAQDFTEELQKTIITATPFNGTKWLMLHVNNDKALDNVKQLLLLKYEGKSTGL